MKLMYTGLIFFITFTLFATSNKNYTQNDIQKAKQFLSDIGIDVKIIDENIETLKKFARTQGYETFTEAMNALVSGQIKANRGISNIDILRLQKYAEQMGNPMAAKILFTQMCNTLNNSFQSQ